MKKILSISYLFGLLLVIWPVISFFFPQIININLYNLFFIVSLSIAIYVVALSCSFTEQTNASWIIINLIGFFGIKEILLLSAFTYTKFIGFQHSIIAQQILLLVTLAIPLIILSISLTYGVYKISKHEIASNWNAKLLKNMIARRNKAKTKKNGSSIQNNDFLDLTVDPED